jgi:voltage-gated potassium channel
MSRPEIAWLIGIVAVIISVSTVFFHWIEGWSWLDSYFFTVVTLTTVGYGTLVPATAVGKIATTILIFFGLGIVGVVIQRFGHFALTNRAEARRKLRDARGKDTKTPPT